MRFFWDLMLVLSINALTLAGGYLLFCLTGM